MASGTVQVLNTKTYSKYFSKLEGSSKARYEEKLRMLGNLEDPYLKTTSKLAKIDWREWPNVQYPDIYNYLITTPSPCTKDQLKAYKSMDGYNFAINGWVDKVQVVRIPQREHSGPAVLVRARVRHSQRLSAAPLQPWVAAEDTGVVICAHCTCMAGLGEAC